MTSRKDLEPAVEAAERAILDVLRARVPAVALRRIGPLDFGSGPSWSCWIVTPTDQDKDGLLEDAGLFACLRERAAEAGFAPSGFTVQSEETVARDYEGSWFYAMR